MRVASRSPVSLEGEAVESGDVALVFASLLSGAHIFSQNEFRSVPIHSGMIQFVRQSPVSVDTQYLKEASFASAPSFHPFNILLCPRQLSPRSVKMDKEQCGRLKWLLCVILRVLYKQESSIEKSY